MSKALPSNGVLAKLGFGGYFGPKENVTVQTAATSAGGLGILFVSAVPAMYRLHLLSPDPKSDFGRLVALTVACAYFGVFFVIPLRTYFIIRQRLVFPTPTATAFTIRSLHSGPQGEIIAKKKSKALAASLFACFSYKVLSGYIPGIFLDWHIGWTLYQLGWSEAIKLENFGWVIEFTPAFFGAGILSGLNASWSFFFGSVLAWGIIGPGIVKSGQAVGVVIDESVPKYISYYSMRFTTDEAGTRNAPSPRYWLLWPGVLMMLVFSFFEIGMSSRHAFWALIKSSRGAGSGFKRMFTKRDPNAVRDENDPDPSALEDRIKTWWWVTGMIVSIIVSCALMATQFKVGVGETILALLLGFIFSFIGVQSAGDTDVNPVSTCAKASQLVFGGVSKGQHLGTNQAQLMNLVAGALSAGAAAQATDMTGDLKTGHLLRAKPKNQFAAQLFGTTIAVFLSVGLFVLFTKASPCIITGDLPCPYGAPSIAAWAAVAFAVTAPSLPIPASSAYPR
jgi:OPT family oligopeptide transporter